MPDPESWQARITAICGAATIGEMSAWLTGRNWNIQAGRNGGCVSWVEGGQPRTPLGQAADPEEALANAILAAVDAEGEGR